jgi:hypothetical protein
MGIYSETLLLNASGTNSPIEAAIEILQNEICSGVLYPSRKVEIIRAEIILAGFTFPIIILRLISRVWVAHRLWWDDWMVIIAAVSVSELVQCCAASH